MNKAHALKLLGGSVSAAARRLKVSTSAVSQWPEVLPRSAEDKVLAALAREHLPAELIGAEGAASTSVPGAESTQAAQPATTTEASHAA
jgi:hypothetical protein